MTRFFIPILVLLMVLTAIPSHAQDVTKAEMAGIRAAYNAAKEKVERNNHAQEQNVPRSDMEVVSHYMIPGCGPTEGPAVLLPEQRCPGRRQRRDTLLLRQERHPQVHKGNRRTRRSLCRPQGR